MALEKAACLKLKEVLDEAKESFVKAEKMAKKIDLEDESKEPSLEVSRAYTKAAQIYKRAVDLIEAASEKKLLHDDALLAFWAYYGYGISLHWKVVLATRLDYDDMTEELGDDVYKSLLMMHEALEIARDNRLNLLYEESLACGILAEELEDQENYEDAYEYFQRKFSIYLEMQGTGYEYVLGLGVRMISCFLEGLRSNKVDANWLTKEAPTAIDCLEKLSKITDLAMKGDEVTLARFNLPQSRRESYVKTIKDSITRKLEALKAMYPDTDKNARSADPNGETDKANFGAC